MFQSKDIVAFLLNRVTTSQHCHSMFYTSQLRISGISFNDAQPMSTRALSFALKLVYLIPNKLTAVYQSLPQTLHMIWTLEDCAQLNGPVLIFSRANDTSHRLYSTQSPTLKRTPKMKVLSEGHADIGYCILHNNCFVVTFCEDVSPIKCRKLLWPSN